MSERGEAHPLWTGKKCPNWLRLEVRRAFDGVCQYCGCSTIETDYFRGSPTVDRIVPGASGGLYVARNVTLACASCNVSKSSYAFIGPVRSLSDVTISITGSVL